MENNQNLQDNKELNQNEITQPNSELNQTEKPISNEKTDISVKENKELDGKDGVFSRSEYAKKDFWNERFQKSLLQFPNHKILI